MCNRYRTIVVQCVGGLAQPDRHMLDHERKNNAREREHCVQIKLD